MSTPTVIGCPWYIPWYYSHGCRTIINLLVSVLLAHDFNITLITPIYKCGNGHKVFQKIIRNAWKITRSISIIIKYVFFSLHSPTFLWKLVWLGWTVYFFVLKMHREEFYAKTRMCKMKFATKTVWLEMSHLFPDKYLHQTFISRICIHIPASFLLQVFYIHFSFVEMYTTEYTTHQMYKWNGLLSFESICNFSNS